MQPVSEFCPISGAGGMAWSMGREGQAGCSAHLEHSLAPSLFPFLQMLLRFLYCQILKREELKETTAWC